MTLYRNVPLEEPKITLVPKSHFGVSIPIGVALVAFLAALGAGSQYILSDPDTYMHIAVGRWILAHDAVPHVGIFSGTMPNAPWVAHEWLAETILALLYNIWGWNGVVLVTALSFAVALAVLVRSLLRVLEPIYALFGTISAWGMVLPHLLARPHILTFPILVVWFSVLVEARDREQAPPIWLVPLMTLWANLQGGYMFGLVFVAIFGAEGLVTARTFAQRLAVVRQWGVFGVLATAACLITPFGIGTLWLPFHVMQMKFALSSIGEWQSPNFQHFQFLEVWLVAALALVLCFGVRLPVTRVAMLLLLLHMSLVHQRNIDLLGLLTPLLVMRPVSERLRARTVRRPPGAAQAFARFTVHKSWTGIGATAALFLAVSAAYLVRPIVRIPDQNTPAAALLVARNDHLIKGQVLNEYTFGGYLIFSGVAPFIDGRAELYGDRFIKQYVEALTGNANDLSALLNKYHVTWALLATRGPGATLVAHLPGWRRVYADTTATLFARSDPAKSIE